MEQELVNVIKVPEWKSELIRIVEREGMDPWDIDIVRLAEAYRKEIEKRKDDLTLPANAVLACSILLYLKAKVLRPVVEEPEPVMEEPEPLEVVEVEETPLEVVAPVRVVRRRVTLDELMDAMEKIMRVKTRKRVKPEQITYELPEPEEDSAEEIVEEVYKLLKDRADSDNMVLLSRVLPEDPKEFARFIFSLVYLASQGRVDLLQDRPFGEVIVRIH